MNQKDVSNYVDKLVQFLETEGKVLINIELLNPIPYEGAGVIFIFPLLKTHFGVLDSNLNYKI